MRYHLLALPIVLGACVFGPGPEQPRGVGFSSYGEYSASRPSGGNIVITPEDLPAATANYSANKFQQGDFVDLSMLGIKTLHVTSGQFRTSKAPLIGQAAFDKVLDVAVAQGGTAFHTGLYKGVLSRITLDGGDYAAIHDLTGGAPSSPEARNEALALQVDALTGCRAANIFSAEKGSKTFFVLPLTCAN